MMRLKDFFRDKEKRFLLYLFLLSVSFLISLKEFDSSWVVFTGFVLLFAEIMAIDEWWKG